MEMKSQLSNQEYLRLVLTAAVCRAKHMVSRFIRLRESAEGEEVCSSGRNPSARRLKTTKKHLICS